MSQASSGWAARQLLGSEYSVLDLFEYSGPPRLFVFESPGVGFVGTLYRLGYEAVVAVIVFIDSRPNEAVPYFQYF